MITGKHLFEIKYRSHYHDGREAIFTAHYFAVDEAEARLMWETHFGANPKRTITLVRPLP